MDQRRAGAQRRFERLIRVSRAAVDDAAHRGYDARVFGVLEAFSRTLAREMCGSPACDESAYLTDLRAIPGLGDDLLRRIDGMAESEWRDRSLIGRGPVRRPKIGASSMSPRAWETFANWWLSELPRRPGAVVAILSRGLPDAALVAEALSIPLRFICCSRSRRGIEEVQRLDCDSPIRAPSGPVLLVDAHRATGETLRRCWANLTRSGIRVEAAVISQDDGSDPIPPASRSAHVAGGSVIRGLSG